MVINLQYQERIWNELNKEVGKLAGNPRGSSKRKKNGGLPHFRNVLVSGDTARDSGLYALEHNLSGDGTRHQEIFVRKGTKLPLCQECGNSVKFRLLKKMMYIDEDPDFQ